MKCFFCVLLFGCFALQTWPQSATETYRPIGGNLTFHLLDVESGLSHDYVNSIEQDSLGFIWIATIDGLNRYDGSSFLKFKKSLSGGDSTLLSNHVQQIKIYRNGDLLIATDSGPNKFELSKEKLRPITYDQKLPKVPISSITNGPNDDLILGMVRYDVGLAIIQSDGIHSLKHDSQDPSSISSNNVSSVTMQGDSVLWAGTQERGLNKINYFTKSVVRIPSGPNSSISAIINTVYTDREGNIWIGSNNGLNVITKFGDTLTLRSSSQKGKGLSGNKVLSFEEDDHGRIWVGTRNRGLNIFDKSSFLKGNKDFEVQWFLPKSDGSSVFNRTVSCIKMDNDGNMWLGTSTGVNFVRPDGDPITLIRRNEGVLETLSHNRIGSLAEGKDGKIWIGTDGGGLDHYDPFTGSFSNFDHDTKDPRSLSNNYVISLLEDSTGRVWAGTYQGGLNLVDPKTGFSTKYLQGRRENGSDVRTIFEDDQGTIWVGTNRGGLFRYDEVRDRFNPIPKLGKIDVRDIAQGENNEIWLATYGDGIIKYDAKTERITNYNASNTKGIPTNVIFCIDILKDGSVLAGTRYGGLMRLNPKTNSLKTYTEKHGLSHNTINSLVLDNSTSKIWLGTSNGISWYDMQTGEIQNLAGFSNIQKGEFNIGASLLSSSGLLYFGGNKGLNIVNHEKLDELKNNYRLVFKSIEVFNEPIPIISSKKEGFLQKSVALEDEVVLTHNQTLFSFGFAVLKYPTSFNTVYAHKLEGYHSEWIETKNVGTATFINVPPGDYILKIKAKVSSGLEIIRELNVSITPPFWRTLPAYFLYVLFLIAITYAFMKYYSERVKLKNSLLLEKKQRLLEQDINEERIRFFTNFSHELKTPLTLILAPIDDLLLKIKNKRQLDSIRLIQKNAKYLYQTINKLLEFRKSEAGMSELIIGCYNISMYLERLVENYMPLSKKKQVHLHLTVPEEKLMAWCDLEKFQLIVNNLLSNAFKHVGEKDDIRVSLEYDDQFFKVVVGDSGKGIPLKDLPRIFDWYYQADGLSKKKGSGIGLAITKSFVELHGGSIDVESKINGGTSFVVSIPRDKNMFTHHQKAKLEGQVEQKDLAASNIWGPSKQESGVETKPLNLDYRENRQLLLLIDDNPDILQYLDDLLHEEYDLIFAQNGNEGLERAFKYIPDLIISDIMMPQKSGIDLCSCVKNNMGTTHVPIILLSAKDNYESIQMGFEEGADDYILKPFNGRILKSRISNLLESRKKLRAYFLGIQNPTASLEGDKSLLLTKEKKFLKKLEGIVLENLQMENADVNTIAKEIGMSRSSLFRKLKAITGHNINEHIRMIRLKKAASLIKNEGLTINQAAHEVGFNSVKYFRKLFKEQFGALPSEYQKKV